MRQRVAVTTTAALVAVALFGVIGAADAATIEGSLTAISGMTMPASLSVQSGPTSYTVNVTSATELVRKFNGESTLEEFAIGDLLEVEGTVTGTVVDPTTKIKNLTIQRRGSLFWGQILSIDTVNKTFTLDPKHRKSLDDQTVFTTASTKFFQGNRQGDFDDLAIGMNVRVVGLWRKSLDKITADRILIRLTEINGTISTINCDATPKTLTVKTNKGKKSENMWTVNLTSETILRDKELTPITCADMKANHRVHVRGLRTGSASLNALAIWDRGLKKAKVDYEGTISSIDSVAQTFVLDRKEKADLTVTLTAETIIVNDEGIAITFASLAVGHKIKVKGVLTDTTLAANLIMDKDLPEDSD